MLRDAARKLKDEPERIDEARQNIARFLDHAKAVSESPGNEIDEEAIQQSFRDLCPIWPIC